MSAGRPILPVMVSPGIPEVASSTRAGRSVKMNQFRSAPSACVPGRVSVAPRNLA